MNSLVIGQYVPGTSFLHRLDPRAKLLFVLVYMILVFKAGLGAQLIFILFTFLGIYLSRISLAIYLKALKPAYYLIIFTAIFQLLFTKGHDLLFSFGFIKIYQEALVQTLFLSIRFLLIMFMASFLTFTTSPIQLTNGLEQMLKPLEKWKLPVHEFALMISIALRFIPTLWEETDKIMKAQMARGVDFETGNIVKRVMSYIPVLIPLFISAFRRAEELALAMEARGYRGSQGRTKFHRLAFSPIDLWCMGSILVLGFVAWW